MTRARLPGSFRNGSARIDTHRVTLIDDTELANTVAPRLELVVSRPTVRWQTSGGRIPRSRRMRRFIRALFRFFTARKADLL